MAKRWLWITFAMLVSWSRLASAQVTIPDPINVGSVLVGGTGSNTGTLGGTNGGVNVDLELTTTCTGTGTGTFTLSPSTNIDPTAGATITVTYEPDTRGLRECTVNIFNTGTKTPASPASFKVRGTGVAPVISTSPWPSAIIELAKMLRSFFTMRSTSRSKKPLRCSFWKRWSI